MITCIWLLLLGAFIGIVVMCVIYMGREPVQRSKPIERPYGVGLFDSDTGTR